jgi:hypothetical protein
MRRRSAGGSVEPDMPPRRVAHVDLVRLRLARIARVADAVDALLEIDASELDLARDIGLGLRDLDAAALEHAAVALVLEVLLVRDEVGELFVVAQHDVDRLRQAKVFEVDVADLRVEDHEVVALAVDRVARLHLDTHVAARAGGDLQIARVAVDNARGVQELVVQLALLDVIALGVVPVLLGGQEPLEEVDALETLNRAFTHGLSLDPGGGSSSSV